MDQKCYQYGLRLLARQGYSRHKLDQTMERKGFKDEERKKALELLIQKNYLQENTYGKSKMRTLMRRGESPALIQKKLKQEKMDFDLHEIEKIFAENGTSSQEQIDELIKKKMPPAWPQDSHQSQRLEGKIMRYLLARGHQPNQSKEALRLARRQLSDEKEERVLLS